VWEIEFGAAAPGDGGAGLRRVDHVAQTMNYEDMLSWVLFYTAIFDTTKSPMIDVLDPSGLVRSQVVESPGGRLRLTLNGADNSRTIAGHFISETFGSSTQHLAFACDDIFATSAAMTARASGSCRFSRTTMRISQRGSVSLPTCWRACATRTSFMTAMRTASFSSSTAVCWGRASSSRSSSGAATTAAMAGRTHPSGSPPSAAPCGPRTSRLDRPD